MHTYLQEVRIDNFKLFDENGVVINPGRITVFIGANGTGKSSVLQALLLLKQSLGHDYLKLDGPILNLGTLRDVMHNQDVGQVLGMELVVGFREFAFDLPTSPEIPHDGLFTYGVDFVDGHVTLNSATVGTPGEPPVLQAEWENGSSDIQLAPFVVDGGNIRVSPYSAGIIGSPIQLGGMSSQGGRQTTLDRVAVQFRTLLSIAAVQLQRVFLVPPIRGFDRLAYSTLETVPQSDLTAAGGPDEQAQSVMNLLAFEPDYVDKVSEWLQRSLPAPEHRRLRTRLGGGSTIFGESIGRRMNVNLVNEAFGLNQLIAPLLWLASTPTGSLVGIEEPEIHLHPRAQAALSSVFAEAAKDGDKQLVLITHSEHILTGLLAAVAEERLAPEELAVYEFRREGDTARAERLEVNQYGQIQGGLSGFLEVDLDEIGSLLAARFPKV